MSTPLDRPFLVEATPFDKALGEYDNLQDDACLEDLDATAAYLLVERSRKTDAYWLTTHGSQGDASQYHDNQEYADDWMVVVLIDLRTGEQLQPTTGWAAPEGDRSAVALDVIYAACGGGGRDPEQRGRSARTHLRGAQRHRPDGALMAAGVPPAPGSEYGPCAQSCEHEDCALTRTMAAQGCVFCGDPIGYDCLERKRLRELRAEGR